jgi:hypothetical protein
MKTVKEVAKSYGEEYYAKNYGSKGKSILDNPVVLIFCIAIPVIITILVILSLVLCCLKSCKQRG